MQCPDKPNVTNSIVCSSCGGAGHIARDCRAKRPGQGTLHNTANKVPLLSHGPPAQLAHHM